MKVANDSKAPLGMALMAVAFVLVMSLALLWPRSPGNKTTGYSENGEAVQSDTVNVLNQKTSQRDDRSARQYR